MKMNILFATGLMVASSAFAQQEVNRTSSTLPTAREVRAESEYKPHVGAQLGVANPEGSYDTGSEIGLDIGFQPYIPFGAGLELTQSRAESKGEGRSLDRTTLLAKGTYNFGGDTLIIKDSYVGFGLGSTSYSGGNSLVFAPLLGFDIALNNTPDRNMGIVTAGALAKYQVLEGSAANVFSINGMLKYWF